MKLEFFSTSTYLIINLLIICLATISIIIHKYLEKKGFLIIIINILCELIFNYLLLFNVNYFFLFIFKLIQFIFSIQLNELIYLNKKSANLFMPYIIWNYLLTLISLVLLFLNISI